MKNYFLITLMLIVGYSCSTNQSSTNQSLMKQDSTNQSSTKKRLINQKETGWDDFNLKGNVKSLTENTFAASEKFEEIQKERKLSSNSYLFDNNGRLLEQNILNNCNNCPPENYTFKYDEKGNKIESNYHEWIALESTVIDDNGNQSTKYDYKQDSSSSLKTKNTYRYDEKGNQIEDNSYEYIKSFFESENADSKLTLKTKCINKFNTYGDKIESVIYNGDGSISNRIFYKYNENGILLEKIITRSDTTKLICKSLYNEKGNEIESTSPLAKYQTVEEKDNNGNYLCGAYYVKIEKVS